MSSLYKMYIEERGHLGLIEKEWGFATYFPHPDPKNPKLMLMYIADIFVVKEERKNGKASELADEIAKIAKKEGFDRLMGTTILDGPDVTQSMKTNLGYGFKFHSWSPDGTIYWVKDI